ncbi:YopX family protein [Enterococcus malodoratus]|uniref:YopX family protein n=1 Tax=Enterococcus malodoratus TaxID=71451 RepID=UPI0039AF773A
MIPKFRAWWIQDEVMTHIDTLEFLQGGIRVSDGCWHEKFLGDEVILMQSTGLKDKNGVEIFEGDVVNYDDGEFSYIGSVKKDCYQFYINGIEPVDSYDFIDVSNTFDGTTSLTILGNIYEDKELLEAIE